MSLKSETVRARISSDLKMHADEVLGALGMNMSDAIRIFLTQVSLRHEFPIELKVPNKTTLEAMAAEPTDDIYESADDLFEEVLGVKAKGKEPV
ncbi:type II toxin-antitoxin system RelB/DinJ family antitoxin [Vibrio cincinnatiensis]|jgi:DNA-damage-inducible protein J|uniref:type II toxin-antitoxin system RelB/DinJ family antitoxin n=1 Tax=Vibrio cincinnatiensis TaxID=675 RepID=UPI001EDD4340|nr:type II toxin-antitoxin system RelB/DinJ family antitoxin [Vibrio cincinnatiensis]MCG3737821.1 type II toxin-antitoxin system RelB/DinJ family antitoxin [Vibrio cincinnatiensis]